MPGFFYHLKLEIDVGCASAHHLLMSVTDRIDDARILYSQGRRHGSLLSVLIAVTATARKRFPPNTPSRADSSKPMGDIEAFSTFLHDELGRMNVPVDSPLQFRGRATTFEMLLYRFVRNELAPKADQAIEIQFHPATGDAVEIEVIDDQLILSDNILDRLGRTVTQSPENQSLFTHPSQPAGAFRMPGR
jgi:hypothetical protein